MMKPLESLDSSHPSVPSNPPPSPWQTVCTWNEEDEIRFVEHEEMGLGLRNRSQRRLHVPVPTRQKQTARRVPGPVYLPALIVVW
jgi:hypothetical protein